MTRAPARPTTTDSTNDSDDGDGFHGYTTGRRPLTKFTSMSTSAMTSST